MPYSQSSNLFPMTHSLQVIYIKWRNKVKKNHPISEEPSAMEAVRRWVKDYDFRKAEGKRSLNLFEKFDYDLRVEFRLFRVKIFNTIVFKG